ncbi:MAG: DUF881 domain-containing protein [Chloroflexota bacterium]
MIRRGQLSLAVVCFLFGIALMMQLRTQNRLRQGTAVDSSSDLAAIAGDLYDNNSTLRLEVDKLLDQQLTYQQAAASNKQDEMRAEVQQLQTFNGVVPVTGPGIELSIVGALRPVDVQDLLNEVRNAGAEAIAIDGRRVVYNTSIGGAPGRVTVDGTALTSPIVFNAVGAPDVLDRALARKGGMLSYLKTAYPNARIDLTERQAIVLPAYPSPLPLRAAS